MYSKIINKTESFSLSLHWFSAASMDFKIDESEDKYEVHLSTLATTTIKKSHVNEALKNLLATEVRDQLLYHADPMQTSSMGILSNIDLALTEAYN